MKQLWFLKSVCIREGTTAFKTGTIQRKSTRNFPPIPRRNFGRFARDAHRVEDLEEGVIKEANRTKRSAMLEQKTKKLQRTIKKLEVKQWITMTKLILLIMMTRVPMSRLYPTAITPRLRARLLKRLK